MKIPMPYDEIELPEFFNKMRKFFEESRDEGQAYFSMLCFKTGELCGTTMKEKTGLDKLMAIQKELIASHEDASWWQRLTDPDPKGPMVQNLQALTNMIERVVELSSPIQREEINLVESGLLYDKDYYAFLCERGLDVSNQVQAMNAFFTRMCVKTFNEVTKIMLQNEMNAFKKWQDR